MIALLARTRFVFELILDRVSQYIMIRCGTFIDISSILFLTHLSAVFVKTTRRDRLISGLPRQSRTAYRHEGFFWHECCEHCVSASVLAIIVRACALHSPKRFFAHVTMAPYQRISEALLPSFYQTEVKALQMLISSINSRCVHKIVSSAFTTTFIANTWDCQPCCGRRGRIFRGVSQGFKTTEKPM